MPPTPLALAAAALLWSAACARETPAGARPVDGFDLLLAPVDSSITLERWIAAHPTDSIIPGAPAGIVLDGGCRSALERGATEIRRVAVFELPSRETLPIEGDTTRFAERACTLRWTAVLLTPHDLSRVKRMVDSLVAIARSSRVTLQRHGDALVAGKPLEQNMTRDFATETLRKREQNTIQLDSALARAGIIDRAATTELYKRWSTDTTLAPAEMDAVVLPLLDRLLDSAATTPSQRATRLLAADLLVDTYAPAFIANADSVANARMTERMAAYISRGARYNYFESDAEHVYANNFELTAYRIDPKSLDGRAAFTLMLRQGWLADVESDHSLAFENVISRGEAALRENAADSGMTHAALAKAYNDVVVLSRGTDSEYVNPRHYKPRAAEARRKAIEHSRAALRLLREPAARYEMWLLGASMIVDRPRTTFFVFIDD